MKGKTGVWRGWVVCEERGGKEGVISGWQRKLKGVLEKGWQV